MLLTGRLSKDIAGYLEKPGYLPHNRHVSLAGDVKSTEIDATDKEV